MPELNERPQAKTAHYSDDEAYAEHAHDLQLLFWGHVELREHR